VESCIVDCTAQAPVLLRPGAVTADDIARIGGVAPVARRSRIRAPGTLAAHYAPQATVVILDRGDALRLGTELSELPAPGDRPRDGFLAPAGIPTPAGTVRLCEPDDADAYARGLYAALREADALGLARVIAVPPPPEGIGNAVRDRLVRAAAASRG
jgi:L-threonylcarbamoyladenylate synthase